uniref:Uncharacterized protein n=1 Tax=Daphnia galeata TaxID=27404 RepID=A0A8J2RMA7_9CRUS|nr:unnamed protein product [Daphnia galeata]
MEWKKGKFKFTVSFFDQFEFKQNIVPIKINWEICRVFIWHLRDKLDKSLRITVERRMDGVIVSLAVLLLSVMAILLGSSAQHQSFIPEKRPGLIHPSSSIEQYSDNGRSMKSWPPNPLTYQITDRKSRKSKGKGPKPLAKLTAKIKKWLKKRDKKLEEEFFNFDNILIAMGNPTPVYDQEFSANGSIPDKIKRRN